MTRDEAMKRDVQGLPIESARELVHVLANVQRRRAPSGTPVYYLINRMMRLAMDAADLEESGVVAPSLEERVDVLERRVDEIAEHAALSIPPLQEPRS
jgi:hypothetical protein